MKSKKKPLKPHYSTQKSKEFWNRINTLPGKKQDTLYACGVLLQNLEGTVLQWLNNAEQEIK